MSGGTTATVKVEALKWRSGYQYRCIVTGKTGKILTSEAATLQVTEGIQITGQPKDQTLGEGETASFTVAVKGKVQGYQWQASTDGGKTWRNTEMSGGTTVTVKVEALKWRSGYQYRCTVTGKSGKILTSEAATLQVTEGIQITGQPKDQTLGEGETASFTVAVKGKVQGYQWQASTDGGKTWRNTEMSGGTTVTVKVEALKWRSGYQYRCTVTGKTGKTLTSEVATLYISEEIVNSQNAEEEKLYTTDFNKNDIEAVKDVSGNNA